MFAQETLIFFIANVYNVLTCTKIMIIVNCIITNSIKKNIYIELSARACVVDSRILHLLYQILHSIVNMLLYLTQKILHFVVDYFSLCLNKGAEIFSIAGRPNVSIRFYSPALPTEIESTQREVRRFGKFASTPRAVATRMRATDRSLARRCPYKAISLRP